jgi:hypothetical protein
MAHIRRPILVGLRQAERPNSEPTRLNDPADERDELSAARGVVNGVVLGAGIWSLIGLLVWFVA